MSIGGTLIPKSIGGDGREPGAETREFRSFCPPDIQPNTRILALCGANDWHNEASPGKDGWFFSDFYLFHHLLEDTEPFRSSNQLWMTCVDPKTLVSKYKEYAHGSRSGDRRVVLDEVLLDRIEASKNIRVIPPKDLLERFLATLRSESQMAMEKNQPLLVFVFGHGEADTFGVAVGGECLAEKTPKLTREKFNSAIRTGVNLTLLITSCFSGGWVLKPMNKFSLPPVKKLNISGMTAVNHRELSRSWACSQSCGRAAGSIYATAVFNALVNMSTMSSSGSSDAILNRNEELLTSPTYVSLCSSVYEAYKEHDPFYHEHGVSFSAQDDQWSSEWRTRSGFPLLDYKKKWEELREVSSIQPMDENCDPKTALGFTGSIGRGYHNVVRAKARAYIDSFPGPDNIGCNTGIHWSLRQLVQGEECDKEELVYLNDILDYRLSAMTLASQYVSFLDLQFPDCMMFDTETWCNDLALEAVKDGGSKDAISKLEKYQEVRGYIMDTKVFDKPMASQGHFYAKLWAYLAIAFIESSSLSIDEIQGQIDSLVRLKDGAQRFLTTMPLAEVIMKDHNVIKHRNRFSKTVKRFRARLRSVSPSKRARKSLPVEN
ncbi:hypothetical protein BDV26DRAFT_292795 [Aspergillus bertholletiae]|uniref:Peptidase C13 family-domain-containing protein n=1 Tax=Aspergillus bertholletiae TaxID=1226010 RepID=A0A5N7B7S9_9EURO|nr:hypothetical protein BDV26DRAFT_292795 [Aspergillus bertholletiae]